MYGDAFGGPFLRVLIPRSPIIIPATAGTPPTPAQNQILGGTFLTAGSAVPAPFSTQNVSQPGVINPLTFTLAAKAATLPGVVTTFIPPLTHQSAGPVVIPISGLPVNSKVPLQEQPQVRAAVLQSASNQFGTGGTLTLLNSTASLINSPRVPNNATWNIATLYDYFIAATPGTPGTPAQVIPRAPLLLEIPSLSGGGVVGRTKIADDNSPMPRDRIIFGYDYFDGVPLTAQGANVHRFSPGFEKTFLDGDASIEVRFPFASTVSNALQADGVNNSGHAAFGNINVTLKALLFGSPTLNIAAGLGIALPTANDLHVSLVDGTEVARFRNESVLLTPYIAFLLTPNDRLFFQNWYQIGFDANGDQVLADPDLTGLRPVGRLNDQSLLQIDAQLGYWAYRSEEPAGLLRGLAPFIELHYNTTLGKANSVQAGDFIVGDPNAHLDELNLTAGFTAQFRDNFNLSVGAVVPLQGNENRTFDWQVGIRGSWLFGRSTQDRRRDNEVSMF